MSVLPLGPIVGARRLWVAAALLLACTEPPKTKAPDPAVVVRVDPLLERAFGGNEDLLRLRLLALGPRVALTSSSALRPDLLRIQLEIQGTRQQLPGVAEALAELVGPSALGAAVVRGSTFSVALSLFRSPRSPTVSATERQRTLQGFLRLTERQLPWIGTFVVAAQAGCLSTLQPSGPRSLRLRLELPCAARTVEAIQARLGDEVRISEQGGGSYELRFPDHVEELPRVSSSSASR